MDKGDAGSVRCGIRPIRRRHSRFIVHRSGLRRAASVYNLVARGIMALGLEIRGVRVGIIGEHTDDRERVRSKCNHQIVRWCKDETGQYLVQTVVLLPMMMILVGLVLDGGWMYWQYRRAEITVNAAAQAASHAIDVEYFRETNQIRLDQGEAWSAASGFVNINQRGQMQVTGIFIGNNQVVVDANAQVQTIFFRLAGISSLSMRVEGRAYPAFGINIEGQ